jgi:arabinofuranan 3-O-arabinosyltransferase
VTSVVASPGPAVQASSVVLASPGSFGAAVSDVQSPRVQAWTESRRVFTVESGAAQVVAFQEGFNPGWQATLDGRPLDPIRVDGWRQGFVVGAGAGGSVQAVFAPAPWYSSGLAAGGLVVGLLVGAALVLRRGSGAPRAGDTSRATRSAPRWAPVAGASAAALALFSVGGYAGVLMLIVVGLYLSWSGPRSSARTVLALLLATGPLVLALDQIGRGQLGRDLAQLLGLAVVAVLAATLVLPRAGDDRPLEEEVRERGRGDARGEGDDQHRPEVAREQPPATP